MATLATADRKTYTVAEAAQVVGISEWLAAKQIRRSGSFCGVAVLHVGRRVLIPKEPLDRVLAGEARRDER